ncbi:MAG: hypothetical protein ACT4ON_12130 [Bacteroidota bacterium]
MLRQFKILIFLILLTLAKLHAQNRDSLIFKRFTFTTSVFDYIPNKLNAINFNLGTEIYLQNYKSISANVGLIKSQGASKRNLRISSLSTKGIKVEIEGKHFINKHKIFQPAILLFWFHIFQFKTQNLENTGYYLTANVFYQNTSTERQEIVANIDNNPFPNSYQYKQNIYSVERYVYGLNVKFGYQCIKQYGLTIDYAVGIGAQYISSYSQNRIGTDNDWPNSERDFPWNKLFDHGSGIYPNFIYQLKLGWAF